MAPTANTLSDLEGLFAAWNLSAPTPRKI